MIQQEPMKETLGEYIQCLRESLGWSQRTLASRAKVSSNTISRIEADIGKPESDTLEKLADALGVPLSRLTDVMQGRTDKEKGLSVASRLDQLPPKIQRLAERMIQEVTDKIATVFLEEFKQ